LQHKEIVHVREGKRIGEGVILEDLLASKWIGDRYCVEEILCTFLMKGGKVRGFCR